MSIINRVKQHISENRGKYGAAAGAGAMYGASKIDSPLLNQAGFNVLAKGQNLALDAADKIDPRATTALNNLGMHKIRQEDIDASNALYNSGVAKYINPNPIDMVNANEHSTEVYNKAMVAKANAQDALVNAKNQGQDYLDQGINYVKGLNPFTENTINIPIKDMLLEGYAPEVIVEAVYNTSNFLDPDLDKKLNNFKPRKRSEAKSFIKQLGNDENKKWIKKFSPVMVNRVAIPSVIGASIGAGVDAINNDQDNNIIPDNDSVVDGALIGAGIGTIPGIAMNINSIKSRKREHSKNLKKLYGEIIKQKF